MLAPNKQNLLLLKSQKKSFENGNKLLTEKRNGLINKFLQLCRDGKALESKLSKDLASQLEKYSKSLTFVSAKDISQYLTPVPSTSLKVEKKRLSGVRVQDLSIKVNPPKRQIIKKDLRKSITKVGLLFPVLVELVQLKLNSKKLADEILKTNRQIANIERKIEDFTAQIKWMRNSLQEKENLEKSVLIKIFEK